VDLAVDSTDLAVGPQHHRGVEGLLVPRGALGEAPGQQVDAELGGPAGGGADRVAVERLGGIDDPLGRPQERPLLGQRDQLRAVGRRLADQPLGDLEVSVVVVGCVQLNCGDAHHHLSPG
jgi:hypothetical protein